MPNSEDWSKRDIWVIGGAGYLGSAVVDGLVAKQARVLCADLGERAHHLVAQRGWGNLVTPLTLDAGQIESLEATLRQQLELRGTPDGLVVMTYRSSGKALEDLTAEEFDAANHVGLTATFIMARLVGEKMAARGKGSLVLFSSMYGTIAPEPAVYPPPMAPNPVEYGVGKAGIQQLARYLSIHWGRSGVRCNSIAPGPFPFPSLQSENPEFMRRLADRTAVGRIGQAAEMVGPVLFLLSDDSSYITGHNLAVDGGWTAW